MPMVPAKQLREKTEQELRDQLALERKRQFDATVRGSGGEAVKPHERRTGKRLIARIQTLLRERALRKALDVQVKVLEPKAAGASPAAARLAARPPAARSRRGSRPAARSPAGRSAGHPAR